MAGETWLNADGDTIIDDDGDEIVCDDCPCGTTPCVCPVDCDGCGDTRTLTVTGLSGTINCGDLGDIDLGAYMNGVFTLTRDADCFWVSSGSEWAIGCNFSPEVPSTNWSAESFIAPGGACGATAYVDLGCSACPPTSGTYTITLVWTNDDLTTGSDTGTLVIS
jgi:hypothetical protein